MTDDTTRDGLDTTLLRRYREAVLEYRQASAQAKATGAVKSELEQQVGDVMALEGTWKWGDADGSTLSCNDFLFAVFPEGREAAVHAVRQTDWAQVAKLSAEMAAAVAAGLPVEAEQSIFQQVCAALAGPETGELLAFDFNANALSAYVRERVEQARVDAKRTGTVLADEQDALPPNWKGAVEVGSKWRVGVTQSRR